MVSFNSYIILRMPSCELIGRGSSSAVWYGIGRGRSGHTGVSFSSLLWLVVLFFLNRDNIIL